MQYKYRRGKTVNIKKHAYFDYFKVAERLNFMRSLHLA